MEAYGDLLELVCEVLCNTWEPGVEAYLHVPMGQFPPA